MSDGINIPVAFYEFLYEKIYQKVNIEKQIGVKEAKEIIGMQHNIPIALRPVILTEMERLGWLRFINRDKLELKRKLRRSPLEDTSRYYRVLKCF